MPPWKAITLTFYLIITFYTAEAAEPLRLVCNYTGTVDDKGRYNSTSGQTLLTITVMENSQAIIKKDDLGADFFGSISKDAIRGKTEYKVQKITIQRTLDINRFTGSFTETFETQPGNGLVHYGNCQSASKQLF